MTNARTLSTAVLSITLLLVGPACADDSLHSAAHRGDVAQVTVLLKKGVDPDARDSYGGTALHAAMFQPDIRVVELLIAHGFDVNAVGPRNGTATRHCTMPSGPTTSPLRAFCSRTARERTSGARIG